MQVSVEQTSELRRKMKVQVPDDTIQSECAKRIDSLAKKIKIDGFRPGKVPVGLIRKRYGASIRNEVIGEMIRSSLMDALKDHDLRPAGAPYIESTHDEAGKGLEFEASFEVFPDVQIGSFEQLNIVRPVCEITEADIQALRENLRLQRRKWEPVEREAREKDRVTVSFSGTVGDEDFTEGTVDDFDVEIGSNKMIPGFEDHLVGLKADDEKTFRLTFPEDYGNEKLAGKEAEFKVRVKKVEESILPEIDAEFAKQFGIESGDLDEFQNSLKETMEKEMNRKLRTKTKNAVMDALLEANAVTLPDVMVDHEIEHLKKQHATHQEGVKIQLDEEQQSYYETQARRRVKLGLLLSEIIAKEDLKADRERVHETIVELSRSFNSPDAVVDWYYSNPEQLQNIEQMVLEDQVVDLVLQGATVTDEPIEFSSLTTSD